MMGAKSVQKNGTAYLKTEREISMANFGVLSTVYKSVTCAPQSLLEYQEEEGPVEDKATATVRLFIIRSLHFILHISIF